MHTIPVGFSAGTLNPTAGAYSSFVLNVSRPDGSQQLSRIKTTLPVGLLGKLAGIPYCPSRASPRRPRAAAKAKVRRRSPSRPAPPLAGGHRHRHRRCRPEPLTVTGKAYLAGPYKGAPLSLEIVTPAIAGPFDLGVVAVRTALQVDPTHDPDHRRIGPDPDDPPWPAAGLRSISIDMDRRELHPQPDEL